MTGKLGQKWDRLRPAAVLVPDKSEVERLEEIRAEFEQRWEAGPKKGKSSIEDDRLWQRRLSRFREICEGMIWACDRQIESIKQQRFFH